MWSRPAPGVLLGPALADGAVPAPLDLLDEVALDPDLEESVGDVDLDELVSVLAADGEGLGIDADLAGVLDPSGDPLPVPGRPAGRDDRRQRLGRCLLRPEPGEGGQHAERLVG